MFPSQRFHRYPPQIWTKIYKKKGTFPNLSIDTKYVKIDSFVRKFILHYSGCLPDYGKIREFEMRIIKY